MDIKQVKFDGYFQQEFPKTQIYLHHTAGAADGERQFQFWQADPVKVATCVCIGRSGEIAQGFSSKYWAHHLGLSNKSFRPHKLGYRNLDRCSIGIELCNWGWLKKENDKFLTYTGHKLHQDNVTTLDKQYRGHLHWETYTDAQIQSVKELLLLWRDKYGIPLDYNEDIWDVTKRAFMGQPGVYTHNSVRPDKTDVSPQPKLIQMLKSL